MQIPLTIGSPSLAIDLDRAAMDAVEGRTPARRYGPAAGGGFAAAVGNWAYDVVGALETIFKLSVQELVSELNALVPVDTGFLRASLRASTSAMPVLSLSNPGGSHGIDAGQIELVIMGADIGNTIYLGYTANYGAHVHYGANGRPGRPWVDMVAQRWASIVAAKSAEVKARLGL